MTAAALAVLCAFSANAAQPASSAAKEPAKEEAKGNLKIYGFVRNYFAFDSRESTAGTGDLFYYLPKDENISTGGEDLNAIPSFRFLSITSRLGFDVTGYKFGSTEFGAKIETDFYNGLAGKGTAGVNFPSTSSLSGTAILRLRQAYVTLAWKDLADGDISVNMKIGQAWHPISADQPAVFSLETGAPFNPFSRTPQVTTDFNFGKHFTLTGSFLWQQQYLSTGPDGASANYMKYGCTPEFYYALSYKAGGFLMRAGATVLSIKPRALGKVGNQTVHVSDRITTMSPYFYVQYTKKNVQVKAKTVYGSAGEHFGLMSGYGITSTDANDGHYEYAPLHSSSSWASVSVGKKWQGTFMAGYIKNLGANTDFVGTTGTYKDNFYFNANGAKNLDSVWRLVPAVCYNAGKFTLGLEYNLTCARYGSMSSINARGLATQDLHNIINHRVQMMVKFSF